ncbi:S1 family peptidase [Corynebacterium sp. MC-04]|uniref:S1 family peptidase n=1 Tax=Corynebacterium parakroppenstedtii TaxID=2828363 RepID=A0ABS9HP35_9CORY|nr:MULTISPECIES: hypothetical protein [Corynebacterium]MDU3198405.1 hypothetical protein [Corynebacterium kroppenstedtii]MBY0789311.1 hypothetical protein [Corynebacterium parakroppenstedtii]MBY0793476.1 hypothetical protein [Corynebacterium parakroppenstedtii]MCF6770321.1 S1 family peptidase [Corynebacterium parakroppenstedtii]MCF6772439.1 S1 family peptidase [Corynebacterium parakroppenstedtii]
MSSGAKKLLAGVVAVALVAVVVSRNNDDSDKSSSPETSATQKIEPSFNPDWSNQTRRSRPTIDQSQVGGGNLGRAASGQRVRQDSSIPQKRKIIRNSQDFEYLEAGDQIAPGGKYFIEDLDGNFGECSWGWTVINPDDTDHVYNLTAGHCGSKRDKVYLRADNGEYVNVGEFVWSVLDGTMENVGPGRDYGLIEIYPKYYKIIHTTPDVAWGGVPTSVKGSWGPEELEQNRPYTCRLGWRSGLSCGDYQSMVSKYSLEFDGIQDHGDSGGIVWATAPNDSSHATAYAVGIASYGREDDATTPGAKVIQPVLDSFGLQLVTS